jgi:hypothetical protein
MATPSRALAGLALAAALAAAGCGGSSGSPARHRASAAAFGWLRPAPPPAGWRVARLPSGAAGLAIPRGWHAIRTDPGTVSAAITGPRGRIRGYLNATPLSGPETLANWSTFRPSHNREEGDRRVVVDARATHVRFPAATGSCVIDHYATISSRYREIACIVKGAHATTVVVAAARPQDWARLAPQLRRSVMSFAT